MLHLLICISCDACSEDLKCTSPCLLLLFPPPSLLIKLSGSGSKCTSVQHYALRRQQCHCQGVRCALGVSFLHSVLYVSVSEHFTERVYYRDTLMVADRRCVTVACNPMSVENQMEDIRYFLSWRYCRYYLASFRSTACASKWMEFSVFVIILFLVVQFPLPNQHNMLLDKEYIEN